MYYLQSRYYNPSWGRFINADTAAVLVVSLDSAAWDKNLYAYCDNNPICRRDVDGDFWVGAVVGGIVSGTISAFTSRKDDGSIDWGQVAIDTAFGALSGAFVGVNKPLVDGLISLTNSVVDEAYSQYKSGFQNFDIGTSLQTVATNTAKDILVGDIVSKKADEALSFVTVPRDIASQSAADYSAKASVREGLEQSSSYYRRRELRQAGISQSLNNWYCGLKSGISSFFGKLF